MTTKAMADTEIKPQPGPQEQFLSTPADIAIYGGAAGGGKTWALLMEPLRHTPTNSRFASVIFRRTTNQIKNPGGLWDESTSLYPLIGGKPTSHISEWRWIGGGLVKFSHMEHDSNRFDWQGSQIPLIGFDELTHFSATQFWYMFSRNRSMAGVRSYIRATCNPDADSWVASFIAWWIDQDTGFAIPERSGKLRWFVRIGETLVWANSKKELLERYPGAEPKSVTFIPAKLSDNQILLQKDPGYLANLMAMPTVERERLLAGNWKIRPRAGLYFQRGWCEVIDAVPAGIQIARGWDLASTAKVESNDPDFTAGTKIGRTTDGRFIVLDHVRDQVSPAGVQRLIQNTASADGKKVTISLPIDPGAGGKSWGQTLVASLAGYRVISSPERGDKTLRFGPFSAQAEAGNVRVLRGGWNDSWFSCLEGFPEAAHDDDVDSTSRAFSALIGSPPLPPMTGPVSLMQEPNRVY